MKTEQLSLARQLDLVFKELDQELSGLDSGVVLCKYEITLLGNSAFDIIR